MKKRSLRVFSRHGTHDTLRKNPIFLDKLACVRLGSTTPGTLKYQVEINSVQAVKVSSDKLLMKQAFDLAEVETPRWIHTENSDEILSFGEEYLPIVAKHRFGSRGTGNTLIKSIEELQNFIRGKTLSNYIFEEYKNYNREYRLHMTNKGCFYTCRKMLKGTVAEENRWFRNDSNCVWIVEESASFNRPKCWDNIVDSCKKALLTVGLDVGAFDVRVQSEKPKGIPSFTVIEVNSAPSFGERTAEEYRKIIPEIVKSKS